MFRPRAPATIYLDTNTTRGFLAHCGPYIVTARASRSATIFPTRPLWGAYAVRRARGAPPLCAGDVGRVRVAEGLWGEGAARASGWAEARWRKAGASSP